MVMLSGCAVGPDYKMPSLFLPDHWSSAEEVTQSAKAPELSAWWRRLNDPMLNKLIEDAVAGNLDVATAKAKVREARAGYREAGGKLLPSLNASGSASRSKSASRSSTSNSSVTNTFQAGFDSNWEIDLFGANRRNLEAAQYGMDAAEEDLRATLLTLIGDVASNYAEARGLQARITLAQQTAASQRETESLIRNKFEAGASSAVDIANATGQASNTEANIPSLQISYTQTVHRLSVLTGRAPTELDNSLDKPEPIPIPTLPIPTGVPADILSARPDVRLAERKLAQSTSLIGKAEAARYPSISLTGNIGTSGSRLGDLGKSTSISWSFGPSLSLPIFNGGQLDAAVEVAQAQRDQSYIALRSSVLTALEDVENAIISLAQEQIRNEKLAVTVASYRQSASLLRILYDTGSTSFLDVLDADRSLYSAEDALISSNLAITTSYIALNKALGGGWDGTINSETPEIIDTDTGPHAIAPVSQRNIQE
ncbi:MAG: efflux transporter outer membrane subunit [Alphaproteobacteria bacterium]|nr:efflux transporter outer membrane subunit [Alphaproteobacteria bacterium]